MYVTKHDVNINKTLVGKNVAFGIHKETQTRLVNVTQQDVNITNRLTADKPRNLIVKLIRDVFCSMSGV